MHARLPLKILTLCAALGLAGCGSGAEDSGGAGGGGTGGAGGSAGGAGGSSSAANGPTGIFEVHYVKTSSIADIGGVMRDGPVAELVIWDKKKTEGDCSLYVPRTPFCESCSAGEVCVDTNVCRAQPSSQSVGDVTLTGLNSATKPLPLIFVAGNYSNGETLSLPACTAGDAVGLNATGAGAYPAFSVQATCIAPLVMSKPSAALEGGKAFTLTWTAGTVADARITAEFDLSHHGGSKGQIRCDTADTTGSLTVSGALMKSLVDLGVTGFPWLTVARVVKGTAPVAGGQVQLQIVSDDKFDLEIPGLKSCNDDSMCSDGETCLIPSYMCGVACTTSADCPSGKTCQGKICK